MAAVTMEEAALAALAAEAARPGGYSWPERSCVSLVEALCRAANTPPPDYGEWRSLGEVRATALALARHGTLGRAHGAVLARTGAWAAVRPGPPVAGAVRALAGTVTGRDGTVYRPPRPQCELVAVVGPDLVPWLWSPHGLTYAVSWGETALEWQCRPA